jgi:uncharacterized protein (TIGR03083 family)
VKRWFVPSVDPLSLIGSEGRAIVVQARRDPDRLVPQYPEWTMTDLVLHTASILARTTLVCATLPAERISAPPPPDGADPFDWYEESLEAMLDAMGAADAASPVWGFVPDCTVAFWVDRMLIETGIHRHDADAAFEEDVPLPQMVAVTGLDEFASMWLPRLGDMTRIRLSATDLDRSWALGSGEPVGSVTGSVSDLYLRLMSRPSAVVLPESWAVAVDGLAPPQKR